MLQSYNVTFLRIRKCLMQDCKNARLQHFKMHFISIKRLLIQTTIHLITNMIRWIGKTYEGDDDAAQGSKAAISC